MLKPAEPFSLTPAPEPTLEPPSSHDIDALIEADRLETLYQRTPQGLVGGLLFSALLAWVFAPSAGAVLAWSWFAVKLLTLIARALDWWTFQRAPQRRSRIGHWHLRHAVGSAVDGLGWGATAFLFVPSGNLALDGALIAGLVGVASVGVFTLTSHIEDAVRFMACVLVPLVLRFLSLPETSASWLVAGGCSIYLVLLWVEGLRAQAHTRELLRLRFENAAIAEERERAWRQAEAASTAKSRFLATVSHELRTPMNGILGMTQLMERDNPEAGQRDRLVVVRQSAGHLLTLIDDLLDISRVEFGRLELRLQPVALRPLLREVLDLLAPVAAARGLALDPQVDPGVPEAAELDALRVKQVLHNLVGNALKFTEQGSVRLSLQCAGDRLQFSVTDSGRGIDPDLADRIFDAFEQGPEARHAGTGLGLTISRQLARAMDGDLTVSSVPGAGATFVFTLACREASLPTAEMGAPGADEDGAVQFDGEVLVVEDNAVNALVATAMLAQLGLRSRLAGDGRQALAELDRGGVDLVLLDCQMPVLDGWEAARQWRRQERERGATARLPIVALTANAVAGDRERCLAAGMDDYLAKPFTREALVAVLVQHLPRQPVAAPR